MDHIGSILGLCRGIFWMASEAKVNKKRCRRLAERVKALEELVQRIKQTGPGQIPQNVNDALWKLHVTLTAAHELVKKCVTSKIVNQLKCMSEFNSAIEGLIDTYHVLQGVSAMASVPYSAAAAGPSTLLQPPPLFVAPAAAPMPQPTAAVFDNMYYSEGFFFTQ